MEKNPAHQQNLRWHLGQLYGMTNDYDKAISNFEQCIRKNPDNDIYRTAWNYYVMGSIAFRNRYWFYKSLYDDNIARDFKLALGLSSLLWMPHYW